MAFAEKIRLTTTAVNQCVLCARVHWEIARSAGVNPSEIRALLENDLVGRAITDESEVPALLYAQHFAESGGNPRAEMTLHLRQFYGPEKTTDIMLIIHLINFFNLTVNTLEAFTSRIRGSKVPHSSVFFEMFLLVIATPIAIPFLVYAGLKGNKFTFDPGPT